MFPKLLQLLGVQLGYRPHGLMFIQHSLGEDPFKKSRGSLLTRLMRLQPSKKTQALRHFRSVRAVIIDKQRLGAELICDFELLIVQDAAQILPIRQGQTA
nr:hypothetical protein [Candidatus Hamiltonella defensa]